MNKSFCKKNWLYILCALICIVSGSVFAFLSQKQSVLAQEKFNYATSSISGSEVDNNFDLLLQNYETTASASDSYYCLTDTDMLFIENQMTFGTCWIYSGTKVLESYLQKTTGVLYDFSESWISVCAKIEDSSSLFGDGGTFGKFFSLVSKYGVLFEEEFPYEWEYNLDGSNYQEIYNNYKNETHKEFVVNLSSKWYASESINSVKQYLVNYGAMSISYNANNSITVSGKKYSYYGSPTSIPNHSITLIGWDDSVSFTDKDGTNYIGAFIGFNSWGTTAGNDEIVYIGYNSTISKASIYGLSPKSVNNFTFSVSKSNSSVDNYEIGKYDYDRTDLDTGVYQDKSVFFYGDIIDIDFSYKFNNGKSDGQVKAKITKDGQDVTNLFSRHFVNKNQNKYELETNKSIDSGRYFIEFSVDYNNDDISDEDYITAITVLSGAEMCYINPSAYTSELYTWQSFNKINSVENPNYVYGYTFGSVTVAEFELSNFSAVQKIEIADSSSMSINGANSLVPATSTSYSKNRIYLNIRLGSERKAYENVVTLKTSKGHSVQFNIVTYALEVNEDFKTFIFFNNNGGLNNDSLVSWIATGKNYNITLGEPTNTLGSFYGFAGWYTDKALTQKINKLNSVVKTRDLSNYAEEGYKGNSRYVRKYAYVYAKWDRIPFYMEGASLGEKQYGDNIRFELNLAHNGSGNYRYSVDNSTLPTGTNLINENDKYYVVGDLIGRGDFSFDFVCYDIDSDTQISATYTLTVKKREISILIGDKSTVFGEPLENLEYSLYSGTIYDDDNLNIKLICTVADDSPIGSYTIYGTYNNENYDVTFINGTYKITNKRIKYTLHSYGNDYDGQEHSVELDVSQNPDIIKVEYSLDGITYTDNPIVEKDFTNGEKLIYIKLSCENYETEFLHSHIKITKRKVTIVWNNTEFTYNGNTQGPTATINGLIDGDDAQLIITGLNADAGNYVASANIDNDNYQIVNNTTPYVIKKAYPNVELSSNDLLLDSEKVKIGDEVGSISLPAGYEWIDPTEKLKEGANIYYARYVPSDLKNYEIVDNMAVTITMREKGIKTEIVKYVVVALCGGIILVILISIITTISRKAYERGCLDNHDEKDKKEKFDKDDQITIYFVTNSPISLEPIRSLKRISIDLPKLERNYYEFAGWYTDKLLINPYKNNGTEKTVTLYAKWLPKIYK